MILTTNEQVFNTIFRGLFDKSVYWRVVSGREYNYEYQYCDEEGAVSPHEQARHWRASFIVASSFAWKYLDPDHKDEGAIINKIRLMARRFERRQQGVA